MKFTIITVCYNAQTDISKTIQSVLGQTYADFQYIIKDGQSTDDTLQIVQALAGRDERVVIESSKDNGIYDAMNQAIQMAEGEYLFFLNAGDCFHSMDVLAKIGRQLDIEKRDILYGDIVCVSENHSYVNKYRNIYRYRWIYLLGACICHQAMFAKKELFDEKLFDTKYRICADRDWQLYYLKKGASFKTVKFTVADVLVDGFSLQNVEVFEREAGECLKKHYPKSAWIYVMLNKVKKNGMTQKLLNAIRH